MYDSIIPFNSVLFGDSVSTPEMARVWSEESTFESWLKVERAIVHVQSELGIIPSNSAEKILEWLCPERFTALDVHSEKKNVDHLLVAFLRAFRKICGEAAEHLHVGPTTQDILDTGLTLQLRDTHDVLLSQLGELEDVLIEKADKYKNEVFMARTHQQHAVPTTLGFVLASWAVEFRDHFVRCKEAEIRWLQGNISGAVGNQNAVIALVGHELSEEMECRVCERLGLRHPLLSLHSRIDRFVEILHNFSFISNSSARMALNIRFWRSSEVGEVFESGKADIFSSSTMPNKDNPEECERIAGLGILVRQQARALEEIQMEGVRDGTRIPVLNVALPQGSMLTSRAVAGIIGVIRRLEADSEKMLKNLNHEYVLQQAVAERLMIAIYQKTGQKLRAHDRLHTCSRLSERSGVPLRKVLSEDPEIGPLFCEDELDRLFELTTYIGNAVTRTEKAIRYLKDTREDPSI